MKIAVTSTGKTIKSPVDPRFGRARYFILYDTETSEWSVYDNKQNAEASIGVGVRTGHNILALGVEAVLAGHCGTWALPILTAGDVDVYVGVEGTVQDGIRAFEEGRLNKLQAPNSVAGQMAM